MGWGDMTSVGVLHLQTDRSVPWSLPKGAPRGFEPHEVHFGRGEDIGSGPIEIACASWTGGGLPSRELLKRVHGVRLGGRGIPLIVATTLSGGTAVLYGPNTDQPPTAPMTVDRASRLLQAVLDEPDALAARRRLDGLTAALDSTSIAATNCLPTSSRTSSSGSTGDGAPLWPARYAPSCARIISAPPSGSLNSTTTSATLLASPSQRLPSHCRPSARTISGSSVGPPCSQLPPRRFGTKTRRRLLRRSVNSTSERSCDARTPLEPACRSMSDV